MTIDKADADYDEFLEVLNAPAGSELLKPKGNLSDSTHTQNTQPVSFNEYDADVDGLSTNDDPDGPIVYSTEELDAMRAVRTKLVEEHGIAESRVHPAFLAVATINCKLRADETAEKIKKMLELMEKLGCPDGVTGDLWKPEAAYELHPYMAVGRDRRGCCCTWICNSKNGVKKEDERAHVHASIMQYLSVHSDPRTLRNGISFVIDMAGKKEAVLDDKKGNGDSNKKLIQAFYQAMPQRPQIIMIAGCNFLMRTAINLSIKLASMFIKQKILARIFFVSVEDAKSRLPEGNAPVYAGGAAAGITNHEEWVKMRLEKLTIPEL
mmetsp:Transcript_43242/g.73740  ORF Transcript_43242/g.73740 Transcript_43242/m.73740 type:complete len:323 (-) Transcript_43242:294-1262(-)